MRKWLLTLPVSTFLLSSNTYAASAANIQVSHCLDKGNNNYDCGQILVGAARIEFNAIRWTGDTVGNLSLNTGEQAFGFTGDSLYPSDTRPAGIATTWAFESPRRVFIDNPYVGANMNYFFAPSQAKSVSAVNEYSILSPTDSKTVQVTGVGISDDTGPSALTLTVKATVNNTETPCEVASCQIFVPVGGTVLFSITPALNEAAFNDLASKSPGIQPVKYSLIVLRAAETNTQCSRSYLSFQDQGVGFNSFQANNYYHYLDRNGPNQTPNTCTRTYPFLVSVGKTFQFQTTNTRDTGSGYVEYDFYVNGHYDTSNPDPTKYMGSWKAIRLTTNSQVTNPQPTATSLTLSVTKNGNGKVTSSTPGIDCGTTCTASYSSQSSVILVATPEAGSQFQQWSGDCTGTIGSATVVMNGNKNCVATFNTIPTSVINDNELRVGPVNPSAGQVPLDFYRDKTTGDVWKGQHASSLSLPTNGTLPDNMWEYGLRSIYLAKYACWDSGVRDWMPTNIAHGIEYCTNPNNPLNKPLAAYLRELADKLDPPAK